MEKVQKTLEVERVVNLVKGFGWDLVKTEADENMLRIVIEKKITPPSPAV